MTEREAFEKWCSEGSLDTTYAHSLVIDEVLLHSDYEYANTVNACLAWLAATSHANARTQRLVEAVGRVRVIDSEGNAYHNSAALREAQALAAVKDDCAHRLASELETESKYQNAQAALAVATERRDRLVEAVQQWEAAKDALCGAMENDPDYYDMLEDKTRYEESMLTLAAEIKAEQGGAE